MVNRLKTIAPRNVTMSDRSILSVQLSSNYLFLSRELKLLLPASNPVVQNNLKLYCYDGPFDSASSKSS